MANRILLIEDEEQLRKMLVEHLQADGFDVIEAGDGQKGLEKWRQEQPDLLLLDIMLPVLSGLEVLKKIRTLADTPVIMLTARSDEIDKLLGLELGADDYVSKPFSPRELTARIRAVLRRTAGHEEKSRQVIKGLNIDLNRYEAVLMNEPLPLTNTEFKILALLAEHPGQVFSRLQILEQVYGDVYEGYERSIDTHINNLRRKIEAVPDHEVLIKSVYGVGYKLVEAEQAHE